VQKSLLESGFFAFFILRKLGIIISTYLQQILNNMRLKRVRVKIKVIERRDSMHKIRKFGWIVLGAVMLLLAACNGTPNAAPEPQEQIQQPQESQPKDQIDEQPQEEQPQEQVEPEEGQPPTAQEAATTVMAALKNGNMSTIAAWAHPKKGVRFSPYGYVDTKTDLVFTRDELEGLMENSKKYVWRTFAGSGELIELTYSEYHKQFVYDADFIGDAEIAVNKVLGESTTLNNLNEVYPKDSHNFVEYHIDGIDPAFEGMDWSSLRLVFEKIGEDHALVGIIHDQWTP
jgi:hypothetical protein